jgi:hypothetical protein
MVGTTPSGFRPQRDGVLRPGRDGDQRVDRADEGRPGEQSTAHRAEAADHRNQEDR